jgi:membrane protein DedA with SNARE-associated domain
MPAGRFLVLDAAAALFWASAYMSVGWVFRGQLEQVGIILERFGALMGTSVGIVLTGYSVKYWQRRHELKRSPCLKGGLGAMLAH